MHRVTCPERPDWKQQAEDAGFRFHTIDGQPYWDESAYYQFTLRQIEDDLEDPTAELEQMCLDLVDRAVRDEEMLYRLRIPEAFHGLIAGSWDNQERNLYGRFDFAYDGAGPAKMYEYNADTPTALYESAAFQWIWLEQGRQHGFLPERADQFNAIHEAMVEALGRLDYNPGPLHLACCKDTEEDRGTVAYIEDCAHQAGIETRFVYIEDIGLTEDGRFADLDAAPIGNLFKLYPWEWLMRDAFGGNIPGSGCRFIEPAWKAILSNKAMLPLLWDMAPGHPNLLPSFFEDDPRAGNDPDRVRKPIFSREGGNVEIVQAGKTAARADGPYGDEGFIVQALHPLPRFQDNHVVIGSWVVASRPCGIGLREDATAITRNTSRFLPHIILD